ncbi:hypothetical protein Tco_0507940 [Tanacetum coccineum]
MTEEEMKKQKDIKQNIKADVSKAEIKEGKDELIDLLGLEVVERMYKDKVKYEKYCNEMMNRRRQGRITNYDVLFRGKGEWREVMQACPNRTGAGWTTIYSQIQTIIDNLHKTEKELELDFSKPLGEQDPIIKLNNLAKKKRKHVDDFHEYFRPTKKYKSSVQFADHYSEPFSLSVDLNIKYPKYSLVEDSSTSILQILRRSSSIFTLVYVAVQKLKKTLARASVQLGWQCEAERLITEYLVNISKRRALWSLNEDILEDYYSEDQYAVSIKEDTATLDEVSSTLFNQDAEVIVVTIMDWEFLLDRFLIQEVQYHQRLLLMQKQPSKKWLNTIKNGTMEHLGPHYTKDCPLKEEGKTLKEAYYTQFGRPFQGGGYRAAAPGFHQMNNVNPLYQEQRKSMEDALSEVIEEFRTRDDKLDTGTNDYPSYCDYDKKIHIDCAYNLKFSCMIGFEFKHANFFPLLYVNVMSKKFHNSIMKDKMVYKGTNVVGALMNVSIFLGTFSVVTDFAVLESMDAYRDEGMGDVIFGEPFLREVRIKTR